MRKLTGSSRLYVTVIAVFLVIFLSVLIWISNENRKYTGAENEIALLQETMENLSKEYEDLNSQKTVLQSENEQIQSQLNELSEALKEKESLILTLEEEKSKLLESLSAEKEKSELFVYQGLVRVLDIDASLVIDLRYATEDNFTGQRVYPDAAQALLSLETALKLKKANERFEKDGYRIKIWDGYRPKSVQEIFWDLVPDPRYVADPAKGSSHNRGASVDVTLIDSLGKELEMPTAYDDFSEKASRDYQGSTEIARENVTYLTEIMEESGFTGLSSEWWHFDDMSRNYPLLDVDFEVFN